MREKKGSDRKHYRVDVWTFSSGCSQDWKAANVNRPDCEFPTEMGLVQRERKPISSLLSYVRTAAGSICQLLVVATLGKPASPFNFRTKAQYFWQRGISDFEEISGTTQWFSVNMCACLFLWNTHWQRKTYTPPVTPQRFLIRPQLV